MTRKSKIIWGTAIGLIGLMIWNNQTQKQEIVNFDFTSPKYKIVKAESEQNCKLASVDYFKNYYNLVDRSFEIKLDTDIPLVGQYLLSDGVYLADNNRVISLNIENLTKKNENLKYLCLEDLNEKEKASLIKNIGAKVNNRIDDINKFKSLGEKEVKLLNKYGYETSQEEESNFGETLSLVALLILVVTILSAV